MLRLADVEALLASGALVVDACRMAVRDASTVVSLSRRPVLFALAAHLAEAWPGDADRASLVARAFRGKEADESHRARLRVEIGRLRAVLRPLASVEATPRGFSLEPRGRRDVVVLAPPVDEPPCGGARVPGRRRGLVQLRARSGARLQPAHRATGARCLVRGRQGAILRPRAGRALDHAAGGRLHDNLVTPGRRCRATNVLDDNRRRP